MRLEQLENLEETARASKQAIEEVPDDEHVPMRMQSLGARLGHIFEITRSLEATDEAMRTYIT